MSMSDMISLNYFISCRYDDPSIALVSGSILRDCMRDEALARWAPKLSMNEDLPEVIMRDYGTRSSRIFSNFLC